MADKLSERQFEELLTEAQELVSVGGYYQHYKGNVYKVIDLAILTEEIGVGVIYQAQYGKNILFVRPLEVWLEKTEHQGKIMQRFAEVKGN